MEKEQKDFRTGTVSLIAFSHLTHDVYTAILAPILPLIIDKLHISYSMAGILLLLLRIPSIFSPIIGKMADKVSTRYFVIFTPATTAIAMSFIGNISSFSVMCFVLFAAGISSAAYHVPAPVMIKHLSGTKTGRGMSFFMFGGELARTIGPVVILTAMSIWGLEGSYRILLPGFIATILLYFSIKDISIKDEFKTSNGQPKIFELIKKRKNVFITATVLVTSKLFMITALTSFLPTYMTTKGANIWLAGAALSIIELAGATGTFLSGSISDYIGRRNMLLIVTLIAPVIMIIFVFTDGWLLFPILVILGLLVFAVSPVIMAYVLDSEKDFPATANSIFMALNFGIGSFVALTLGVLGDIIDLNYTYIISALLSLIAVPAILKMPKRN